MTDKRIGRPTKFSARLARSICDAIAAGQSAREIAATQGIHWQSVCNWRDKYPLFAEQLAAAQAARAELMAAEIIEIADDSSADLVEYETPGGRIKREPNHELVQRSRLRVETRKYLMEKWAPHRYGATQRLELTGLGGGPVLLEQITMVAMRELEAERASAKPSSQVTDDAQAGATVPRLTCGGEPPSGDPTR